MRTPLFLLPRPSKALLRRRHGVALVEFALVMPILLLLTLGMIQFGVVLNARLSLSNTMRQVARFASVKGTSIGADATIKTYAIDTAKSYGLVLKNTDIVIGPPNENTAIEPANRQRYTTQLPITISYDLSSRIFLPKTFAGVQVISSQPAKFTAKVMME